MIKSKTILIFTSFIVLFFISAIVFASENPRLYLDGIKNYNNGEYDKAVEAFEKIAKEGTRNGKLFYNLGNAHFKSGNIGKAIVWYERALQLNPNDPDLKFNYQYVNGFVKDKLEDKEFSVVKVLFFWKDLLGQTTIKWLAVSLSFLFWVMIIFQIFKDRKLVKIHTGLIFSIAAIFILTASYDYYAQHHIKKAVILPEKVSIRSGLTDDSTELFILHVGTKVIVEENRTGHFKIRFSGDKMGWLSKESIEII